MFDHPTVKKKTWCRSTFDYDLNKEELAGSSSSSTTRKGKIGRPTKKSSRRGISVYLHNLFLEKEAMLSEASKLKAKYQYMLAEKKQLKDRVKFLKKYKEAKGRTRYVTNKVYFETDVLQALNNITNINYARFGKKRIGRGTANVVYSSNFLNGVIEDELHKRVTNEYKQIFSPQNILNKIDVNSGSLKYLQLEC